MENNFNFSPNPNTKIARYMSFEKFLDLLKYGFKFVRCDLFEDFSENKIFQNIYENDVTKHTLSDADSTSILFDHFRNKYLCPYALCFNKFYYESNLMWNSYTDLKYGICIISTVKKLEDFFNKHSASSVKPYKCYYTDYTYDNLKNIIDNIPTAGPKCAQLSCVFKLNHYSGENEIRFLIIDTLNSITEYDLKEHVIFPIKEYNCKTLLNIIDCIIISPYASNTFFEFVQNTLKELYSVDPLKVKQSNLKIKKEIV